VSETVELIAVVAATIFIALGGSVVLWRDVGGWDGRVGAVRRALEAVVSLVLAVVLLVAVWGAQW
jgi:hypothetical protein